MRASYRNAVEWIALNDNAGNGDSESDVEYYVTTLLVADIFGKTPAQVAAAVMRIRSRGNDGSDGDTPDESR